MNADDKKPKFAEILNRLLRQDEREAPWLAKKLDMAPTTIRRWLNNETLPQGRKKVIEIARVIGADEKVTAELLKTAGYHAADIAIDMELDGSTSGEPDGSGILSSRTGTARNGSNSNHDVHTHRLNRAKELPTKRELTAAEKQYADMVHAIPEPAYLIDCGTRLIIWNDALDRVFKGLKRGSSLKRLKGRPIFHGYFDPRLRIIFHLQNAGIFLTHSIRVLRQSLLPYKQMDWCIELIASSKQRYPEFAKLWDDAADAEFVKSDLRQRVRLQFNIEPYGKLEFWLMSEPIEDDSRFRIMKWLPAGDMAQAFVDGREVVDARTSQVAGHRVPTRSAAPTVVYTGPTHCPTPEEISIAIEQSRSKVDSFDEVGKPAYLLSCTTHFLYWNKALEKLFADIGASSSLQKLKTVSSLEGYFNPEIDLISFIHNAGEFVPRAVGVLRQSLQPFRGTDWCETMIGEMKQKYPEFARIWQQAKQFETEAYNIRRETPLEFDFSNFGVIQFKFSSEGLIYDPRFRVISWESDDPDTMIYVKRRLVEPNG